MRNATITRRYHRNDGAFRQGDVLIESGFFDNLNEAIDWGENCNAEHEDLPWHITGVVIDDQNFCFFDLSLIDATYDLADIEWREVKREPALAA